MSKEEQPFMRRVVFTLIVGGLAMVSACAHRAADVRRAQLFGKTFSAEYRGGVPYRGSVPYQGASDYFWVIDYANGRAMERVDYVVRDGKPEIFGRDDPGDFKHDTNYPPHWKPPQN